MLMVKKWLLVVILSPVKFEIKRERRKENGKNSCILYYSVWEEN